MNKKRIPARIVKLSRNLSRDLDHVPIMSTYPPVARNSNCHPPSAVYPCFSIPRTIAYEQREPIIWATPFQQNHILVRKACSRTRHHCETKRRKPGEMDASNIPSKTLRVASPAKSEQAAFLSPHHQPSTLTYRLRCRMWGKLTCNIRTPPQARMLKPVNLAKGSFCMRSRFRDVKEGPEWYLVIGRTICGVLLQRRELARHSPIRGNTKAYGGYHLPRTNSQNRKRSLVPIRVAQRQPEYRGENWKDTEPIEVVTLQLGVLHDVHHPVLLLEFARFISAASAQFARPTQHRISLFCPRIVIHRAKKRSESNVNLFHGSMLVEYPGATRLVETRIIPIFQSNARSFSGVRVTISDPSRAFNASSRPAEDGRLSKPWFPSETDFTKSAVEIPLSVILCRLLHKLWLALSFSLEGPLEPKLADADTNPSKNRGESKDKKRKNNFLGGKKNSEGGRVLVHCRMCRVEVE